MINGVFYMPRGSKRPEVVHATIDIYDYTHCRRRITGDSKWIAIDIRNIEGITCPFCRREEELNAVE